MSEPDSLRHELRDLIWGLQSETLAPQDMARLESLLKSDLALRREFIEYMGLISDLQFDADPEMLERTLAGVLSAPRIGGLSAPRPEAVLWSRSPVLGFLNGLLNVGNETPTTSALMWFVMAVLCSGLVLTIFFCVALVFRGVDVKVHVDSPQVAKSLPSTSRRGAGGEGIADASDTPLPAPRSLHPASSASVARLIHIAEPRWAIGSHSPHLGDDLEPGRKLVLLSGLAEVMFQSGVRALLEGPATLEIGSLKTARLRQGKLTVTVVDPDGHGFEVDAPGMKYTDLGTEFGVWVAKDGTQEMVVFRGQVQAETMQAEVTAPETPNPKSQISDLKSEVPDPQVPAPSRRPVVVTANQAIRVAAPGKPIEQVAPDGKKFVRSGQMAKVVAESSPEFIRWKKLSEELNKRLDLVAHYDFQPDDSDRTLLRNRAATGRQYDGRLVGGAEWCEGSFPGKQALAFVEPGSGVRVNIPADCKQMTLLARAKLKSSAHERLRAILMSDNWQGQAGAVHWQFDSQEKSFRLGISPGSLAANVVRSAERFPWADAVNHQWGFYTETFDATTAEGTAYFNGRPVAKDRVRKPHTARIGQAMIGRFASSDPREKDIERVLGGQIDELMIFNSVLTAEEISRIYSARFQSSTENRKRAAE